MADFDWKDLSGVIAASAPMLGGLIGGPAGATVGGIIASVLGVENKPDEIAKAIAADPSAAVKLKELEITHSTRLAELSAEQAKQEIISAQAAAAEINATMRAEASSEHPIQYSWRPVIGFSFAASLILIAGTVLIAFIGVMFFGKAPEILAYVPPFMSAGAALLAMPAPILGVSAWWRGKEKADSSVQKSANTN